MTDIFVEIVNKNESIFVNIDQIVAVESKTLGSTECAKIWLTNGGYYTVEGNAKKFVDKINEILEERKRNNTICLT